MFFPNLWSTLQGLHMSNLKVRVGLIKYIDTSQCLINQLQSKVFRIIGYTHRETLVFDKTFECLLTK